LFGENKQLNNNHTFNGADARRGGEASVAALTLGRPGAAALGRGAAPGGAGLAAVAAAAAAARCGGGADKAGGTEVARGDGAALVDGAVAWLDGVVRAARGERVRGGDGGGELRATTASGVITRCGDRPTPPCEAAAVRCWACEGARLPLTCGTLAGGGAGALPAGLSIGELTRRYHTK